MVKVEIVLTEAGRKVAREIVLQIIFAAMARGIRLDVATNEGWNFVRSLSVEDWYAIRGKIHEGEPN